MKRQLSLAIIFGVVFILTGCKEKEKLFPVSAEQVERLTTPIINVDNKEIGEMVITENTEGVTIEIVAEGLPPGKKGIHIHETGKCTPPDFESAGSHLNPHNKEHGFENLKGYHLGDLPNIEVSPDGIVNVSLTLAEITLKPGAENTILDKDGSAIVIHENEDDYETDPAGNAGARIACAVIKLK